MSVMVFEFYEDPILEKYVHCTIVIINNIIDVVIIIIDNKKLLMFMANEILLLVYQAKRFKIT